MKRHLFGFVFGLFVFSALVLLCAAPAKAEGKLRALLVSCDYFVSRPSTAPSAESNVQLLSRLLAGDIRGYSAIETAINTVSSADGFEALVRGTFAEAAEEDVSVIYISTHGLPGKTAGDASLLLSDGQAEEKLSAARLRDMLDLVPGVKLLILDACHSGAFIGKGLSSLPGEKALFSGPDYKVLCSSGGSEESWYWRSDEDGDPNIQYGASYFATVLSSLQPAAPWSPADSNRDGEVTLREAYAYILSTHAASTPQIYPEKDDAFVLFRYEPEENEDRIPVITDLVFNSTVLTPEEPELRFSFTQRSSAKVYYQLIYYRDGAWNFDHMQMISDADIAPDASRPGRKERVLTVEAAWEEEDLPSFGYVMLLVLIKPENHTEVLGSALLCVQPEGEQLLLSAESTPVFDPAAGEEAAVLIRHSHPCQITAAVVGEDGGVISHLCALLSSRPASFSGTNIYWNGRRDDGTLCPEGDYRIRITVRCGSVRERLFTEPILLRAASHPDAVRQEDTGCAEN